MWDSVGLILADFSRRTKTMYIMTLFHAKISQSIEFGTNWIPEDFFRKKIIITNRKKHFLDILVEILHLTSFHVKLT